MAIVEDVARLRDECLSALDASHDYFIHTKQAWRIVQRFAAEGQTITIRNRATNNTVDEKDLERLAQGYITGYLTSATFQDFVSLFERFVFELLRLWLMQNPQALSEKQVKFSEILEAADKDEIVASVVQREVHGRAYEKAADWFVYLNKIAKLDCPTADQIEQFAEIKASRDILVHNDGVANLIYVDKSMGRARFTDGDKLELPEPYQLQSWQLIRTVVSDLSSASIAKLTKTGSAKP